ncbi:hypothetical protein E3N88_16120 [Mikania micrantha]|uniref:Extensin domain-containing protein n=1 Tax=Mikania micrantha TaxID=192012 RepID=A0A5N6NXD0_9ASTR|nr:hypothetical protein E3N88_16120 [Mikania micrantha]
MIMKNQRHTILILIIITFHHSLAAESNSWPGSKYQIQCTMCAACDNPCNHPIYSPPPPPQPYTPKPSPPTFPPPPRSTGYYYPPPANPYYTYPPPAPVYNYPTPQPPNPIMPYYPYYYYNSPPSMPSAAVSLPGSTVQVLGQIYTWNDDDDES